MICKYCVKSPTRPLQAGSHIRNLQPLVTEMHRSECIGLQNNAQQVCSILIKMLRNMHHSSRLEVGVMCHACGSLHSSTSCVLCTLSFTRKCAMLNASFLVWYSRNSENNTSKYPDLAADVPKLLKEGCKSVVLDCEAVAYDRITKKILPFQVSILLQCQATNK